MKRALKYGLYAVAGVFGVSVFYAAYGGYYGYAVVYAVVSGAAAYGGRKVSY